MSPITFARKLAALPLQKQLLLAEATMWLAAARVVLRFIPFPTLGRHLGTLRPPAAALPPGPEHERLCVQQIGWAVNTAGSHLPVEMVCLPRALAGWQMLHRRGIASRLHFGAATNCRSGEGRMTHAWLTTAGMQVTGYPAAYHCVEIGFFERPGNG